MRPLPSLLALLAGLALAAALAAEPVRITGRVEAPGAARLAGRAELVPLLENREQALLRLAGQAQAPLAAAEIGPDGAFELTAPGAGFHRVIVRVDGYEPVYRDLAPLAEEAPLPGVELFPARSAELRLTGPAGLPLAGVDVEVEAPAGWVVPRPWSFVPFPGTSDADGRVRIPALQSALTLRLFHPRFLGKVQVPGGSGPVRVPRARARLLEVRDAAGQPVPGALVRWRGRPVAATGPDGRVSVALPPTAPAAPSGEPPLFVEGPDGFWATVKSAGDENAPLTVRLAPQEEVAGRVMDSFRRPVAGAWVWPEAFPASLVAVRSDAEGRFRLRLPAGWQADRTRDGQGGLWAAAAGHLPMTTPVAPGSRPAELVLRPAAVIAGRAVDAQGRPVAGARVRVVLPASAGRPGPDPGSPEVRTGADGGFRLPGLLPNGAYELDATHPELARARKTVRTAPVGRPTPPVRLVLGAAQAAIGQVVDAAGQPVAGAEILLQAPRDAGDVRDVGGMPRPFRAEADEAGAFRIRPVAPGVYTLLVRKPGVSSRVRSEVRIPAGVPEVDLGVLELPAGAAIEGRVVDLRGRPVAGAEVFCVAQEPLPFGGGGLYDLWPTPGPQRTGDDGAFRCGGLARGARFHVVVTHARYAPARLLDVEAPTPSPLRIELDRGRVLSGRVVGPDREPVAGATLEQIERTEVRHATGASASGSTHPLGRTDAEGRFEVPGRSAGLLDLQVSAPDYRPRFLQGVQIPADGDPPPLEIVLDRGGVIQGRVLEEDGRPVGGVRVTAYSPEGERNEAWRGPDLVSGADGAFRLTGLPPAALYRLQASAPDGRSAEAEAALGAQGVDLRLPAGAEVSGRVEEADGVPLAGAEVDLFPLAGGNVLTAPTAADGSFRLPGVPAGRYRVAARRHGFVEAIPSPELEVGALGVQGLTLRLTRARLAITGRLLGLAPEQQAGVRIEAHGAGQFPRPGSPDGRGGYEIAELTPGQWHVSAVTPGGERAASGSVEVSAEAPEAVLDLDFGARFLLTGRVRVDRQPLPDAAILVAGTGMSQSGRTGHDGSFRVGGVPAGSYLLIVQAAARGLSHSVPVVLEGDRDITVEIETGSLSGRIRSEDGEPLADVVVQLSGFQPGSDLSFSGPAARTGADGSFTLSGIAAGMYRVLLQKPGFAPAQVEVTVPPGGAEVLERTLAPAGPMP